MLNLKTTHERDTAAYEGELLFSMNLEFFFLSEVFSMNDFNAWLWVLLDFKF